MKTEIIGSSQYNLLINHIETLYCLDKMEDITEEQIINLIDNIQDDINQIKVMCLKDNIELLYQTITNN